MASRERGDQFSGETRIAVARAARSGAIPRADASIQGFWRAVYGAADGIFCARRIAAAYGFGSDFGGHRECRRARISWRAGNSRGDSISIEANQRSPGETVHHARGKYYGAGSERYV